MAKKTPPDQPKDSGPWVEITLSGRLADRLERPAPSPEAAERRKDTETGRRAAQEFAMEALHCQVHIMRHDPDSSLRLKAAQAIQDRAWGKAKPLTEEEKKGEDAATILDMLAAISATQTAVENGHAEQKKIAQQAREDAMALEGEVYDADAILIEAEAEKPNG